VPQLNPPQKTI